MRALNDRPDHNARAAILPRNLGHRRITDREIRRTAEYGREGLRVAAGGAHLHVEAVFLEDAGVHADIEINITEIMDGFAETHLLERRSGGAAGADDGCDRQSARDGSGGRQEMAAAERDTVWAEKSADLIDHGSKLLAKLGLR